MQFSISYNFDSFFKGELLNYTSKVTFVLTLSFILLFLISVDATAQVNPNPAPFEYLSRVWVDPDDGDDSNSGLGPNYPKEHFSAAIVVAENLLSQNPDPNVRVVIICLPGISYESFGVRDRIDFQGYGKGKSILMNGVNQNAESMIFLPINADQVWLRTKISGFTIMTNPDSPGNYVRWGIKTDATYGLITTTEMKLDIEITNMSIYNTQDPGISINHDIPYQQPQPHWSWFNKIKITNCTINKCGENGIYIQNYWFDDIVNDPADNITITNNIITKNYNCGIYFTEEQSEIGDAGEPQSRLIIARNNIYQNGKNITSNNNGIEVNLKRCALHCNSNFITHNGKSSSGTIDGAGICVRSNSASNTNQSQHNLIFNTIVKNEHRGIAFSDPDVNMFIRNTVIFSYSGKFDVYNIKLGKIQYSTFKYYWPNDHQNYAFSSDPANHIWSINYIADYKFVEDYQLQITTFFEYYGDMHIRRNSVIRTNYFGIWDFDPQYVLWDFDKQPRDPNNPNPIIGADNWVDTGHIYIYSIDDRNKALRPIVFLGNSNYEVEFEMKGYYDLPSSAEWYKIRFFNEDIDIDPDGLSQYSRYPIVYFQTTLGGSNVYGAVEYDAMQQVYPPYLQNYNGNADDESIFPLGNEGIFARGLHFDIYNCPEKRDWMLGYTVEVKANIIAGGSPETYKIQLGIPVMNWNDY